MADIASANWVNYDIPFIHENPHGEQVKFTLEEAFKEIMSYAESGRGSEVT